MAERLMRFTRSECGSGVSKEPLIDREGYPVISAYAHKILTKLADFEDAEEQRNKGCNYCIEQEDIAFGMDSTNRTAYIYLDDNVLTADLYSESMVVTVCFCPMCGRELKES